MKQFKSNYKQSIDKKNKKLIKKDLKRAYFLNKSFRKKRGKGPFKFPSLKV